MPISLKPVGGITSHLGHKVILGLSIDYILIHRLILILHFDLGMAPCELLRGGGASAGRPFSFELNSLGEKVGYCQSLSSDVVLLGACVSVY